MFYFDILRQPLISPLFPYTTLFRSRARSPGDRRRLPLRLRLGGGRPGTTGRSRVRAGASDSHEPGLGAPARTRERSEEHTSELQSRFDLVCRLLLEKKKTNKANYTI